MEDLICTVDQGKLRGQKETNIDGGSFISFMGIPYAKPPLGKLRFRSPQPPESWEGVRDATKEGNPCYALQLLPTPEALILKPTGSEDCLFLNVYTRQLPEKNDLKPVMMYVHGGAFTSGSSSRAMYGPEFLMTEDIVLVTINYRLGALGFMVVDDPSLGATGNAGLKDQVQALKWIQKNINKFGGNPDNVTIFGESAGAGSVHYLVLSPLAKGLFHRAIMQSGSVYCPWSRGTNSAAELANVLGCEETDNTKILQFLQNIPVEQLIEGQVKLGDWLNPVDKRRVGPTVEPKVENALISDDPFKLIESGEYNQVPLMFGYTSLEGLFDEGNKLLGFKSNWEEFVPHYFRYDKNSDIFKNTNEKISKFYFGTKTPDSSNKEALYTVLTDSIFLRGIHLAVKSHVKSNQPPVYYYRMTIDTELNMVKKLLQLTVKGVCHGDDIGYLFKAGDPVIKPDSIEDISLRRFVKLWTNFAKTGNPTPQDDPWLDVNWKPATEDELNFLDIGTELVAGVDPDIDRMNFWDEISDGVKQSY